MSEQESSGKMMNDRAVDLQKRLKELAFELKTLEASLTWNDKWTDLCLRPGPTDRSTFETAVEKCYCATGNPWHGHVVWLPSPAAKAALPGEVNNRDAHDPRDEKLDLFTRAARQFASHAKQFLETQDWRFIPDSWAWGRGIIHPAVNSVLLDAFDEATADPAYLNTPSWSRLSIARWESSWLDTPLWWRLMGNLNTCHQHNDSVEFDHVIPRQAIMKWPDITSLANISFLRNVLGITLPGDAGECLEAFEAASKEVLGWYPTKHYVIAWERPETIHVEQPPTGMRRLHADRGPAVVFPDGWSIYAIHGVVIPFCQRHIVEQPETITLTDIEVEIEGGNAEIRRIMIERYGAARFLADSGASVVHELPADHPSTGLRSARLLRREMPHDGEPIVCVDLLNSTPEPDGSAKRYLLRVDPNAYGGEAARNAHAAAASTWRNADGSLVYADWHDYWPFAES